MSQPPAYFPGLRFLHSPGPTHVPKSVLDAITEQPMDMGDERLDPLIADCEAGLRAVMRTEQSDVFVYSSNGHGVWEAVTVNLAAPGQKVLVASTGHFSDSWALMTITTSPAVQGGGKWSIRSVLFLNIALEYFNRSPACAAREVAWAP